MTKHFHISQGLQLNRRTMLRGAGVALGLPWLSAMERAVASTTVQAPPRRFVAMTLGLGLLAKNLFPEDSGRGYKVSPYLKPLSGLRSSPVALTPA